MNSCPRESLIRRNTIVFIFFQRTWEVPITDLVRDSGRGCDRPPRLLAAFWGYVLPILPSNSPPIPSAVSEFPRLSIYMKIFFTFDKNIWKNVLSCILFSEFRYPCLLLFYSLKHELFYEISFKFGHEVEERPRKMHREKFPRTFLFYFLHHHPLAIFLLNGSFSARTLFFITYLV